MILVIIEAKNSDVWDIPAFLSNRIKVPLDVFS